MWVCPGGAFARLGGGLGCPHQDAVYRYHLWSAKDRIGWAMTRLEMVRDAMRGYLDSLRDRGYELPQVQHRKVAPA